MACRCISSIPQELHIIRTKASVYLAFCEYIIIAKVFLMHTYGCDEIQRRLAALMIYTLKRDDIPLLSQWIKNTHSKECVFFGSPCPARTNDPPLAVPGSVCGRKSALPIADRYANPCSLYLAPRAFAGVAVNSRHAAVNQFIAQLQKKQSKKEEIRDCVSLLFGGTAQI